MSETDSPQHQTPAATDLRAAAQAMVADHLRHFVSSAKVEGAKLRIDLTKAPFFGSSYFDDETLRAIVSAVEALAASPPQAETPGLDREAVARPDISAFVCVDPDGKPYWPSALLTEAESRQACFGKCDDRRLDSLTRDGWRCLPVYVGSEDAILAATAVSQPPTSDDGGWREDPGADERWNAGLDYGLDQLCAWLDVDRSDVCWDAATETLDGDVRSVIGNILRRKFGDDFDFKAVVPVNVVDPAQPPTSRQGAGDVEALRKLSDAETIARKAYENSCLDPDLPDSERYPIRAENSARQHNFSEAAKHYVRTHVLPAQPGPAQPGHAPVGDGGTIEALVKAAWSIDSRMGSELPRAAADQLLVTPEFGITAGDLRLLLKAIRKVAALDSIPAAGGTGWQPIETAPKDGTEVPCLAPSYDGPVMLKFYKHNGSAAWRDWDQDTYSPTHWMPLPAAPTQTARDGGE